MDKYNMIVEKRALFFKQSTWIREIMGMTVEEWCSQNLAAIEARIKESADFGSDLSPDLMWVRPFSAALRQKIDDTAKTLDERQAMTEKCARLDFNDLVGALSNLHWLSQKTGTPDIGDTFMKRWHDFFDSYGKHFQNPGAFLEQSEEAKLFHASLVREVQARNEELNKQLLCKNQQQASAKKAMASAIVHNVITYRHSRSRAYRSPARRSSASTNSSDDEGGSESDSGDPPKRLYQPLTILKKTQSNSCPLAVTTPRHMLHGLRSEAAA